MKHRLDRPGVLASVMCALSFSSAGLSADAIHPICPLVLQQEEADREALELAVEMAVSRLEAAESIFALVDQLWKQEAVERIAYLTTKYDRDVAGIEVKRQRLYLERQEAEVAQYEIVCSAADPGETLAQRRARLDKAHRQYLQADCHRIGKELAIAEVELTYRSEVLASVRDLREHDGAAEQDVIRAARDVTLARKRVNHKERRVRECVDAGEAATERPGE